MRKNVIIGLVEKTIHVSFKYLIQFKPPTDTRHILKYSFLTKCKTLKSNNLQTPEIRQIFFAKQTQIQNLIEYSYSGNCEMNKNSGKA